MSKREPVARQLEQWKAQNEVSLMIFQYAKKKKLLCPLKLLLFLINFRFDATKHFVIKLGRYKVFNKIYTLGSFEIRTKLGVSVRRFEAGL